MPTIQPLSKLVNTGLFKRTSHLPVNESLEGLSIESCSRKIEGYEHTIWQLIKHLTYWQDLGLKYIIDPEMAWPDSPEAGWAFPDGPFSDEELDDEIKILIEGLKKIIACFEKFETDDGDEAQLKRVSELYMVVPHTSYHLGQIVLLRQLAGNWPPPSGGYQW